MTDLPTVSVDHDHDPALPDRAIREHVLAIALRAAHGVLSAHGFDPE